jgi:hypothetical protein
LPPWRSSAGAGHALEDLVDDEAEVVGVLEREAEHLGDHPHRDVLRVLDGGVHHVVAVEGVEQLLAALRVNGSSGRSALGEKAGSSRRRAPAWNGGSLVMGGAPRSGPAGRPDPAGRSRPRPPVT